MTLPDGDGSRLEIPDGFEGTVNVTLGDGNSMVVSKASDGTVNIDGGDGDNTFVVANANITMGTGANVLYPTGGDVNIEGYDADTGSQIRLGFDNIYDAIENGDIAFGNGSIETKDPECSVNLDGDAGNVGTMTSNLTDVHGNVNRVMNSYSGGGSVDASGTSAPALLVGNSDGLKAGSTAITSGSGNDSAIAGAGDTFFNTGGTDDVNLKHTRDGGVTVDMTRNPENRATNNLRNYSPLFDFFRQTAEIFADMTARFVNGRLQTRFGNVTNNFLSGTGRDLADLNAMSVEVAESDATVKVDFTDASTTVKLTDNDQIVIDATGYEGDAVLIGNENDNVIYGGSGNNSLWGGDSGDDTLFGGDGYNEYFYLKGNGDDVIENAKDGDVIKLLDISIDDINARFTEVDDDKVVLSMQDGGSLTLNGKADVTFELNDGTKFGADRKNKGFNRK